MVLVEGRFCGNLKIGPNVALSRGRGNLVQVFIGFTWTISVILKRQSACNVNLLIRIFENVYHDRRHRNRDCW